MRGLSYDTARAGKAEKKGYLYSTAVGFVESLDRYISDSDALKIDQRITGMYLQGIDLEDIYIHNGEVKVRHEYV